MFGTVEYGLMLFSYSSMQAAARDVTRQVAVNTLAIGGAQAEIRSRLPGWMRDDATISVTQTTPGNAATNVYTATVSVSSDAATPLTFFTRAAPFTLETEVEMKQELPFL
jgi:Flp pilus assembly protein TadG